jgi:hypothetical protein
MKFKSLTLHSTAVCKSAVVWPNISTADGMELQNKCVTASTNVMFRPAYITMCDLVRFLQIVTHDRQHNTSVGFTFTLNEM